VALNPNNPDMQPTNSPNGQPGQARTADLADFFAKRYKKRVERARILLFVFAAGQMVSALTILIFKIPEADIWIAMGLHVLLSAVFAGLAVWTKDKPYTATMAGLIVYLSSFVMMYIVEQQFSFFKGGLLKVFYIMILIRALKYGKDAEKDLESQKEAPSSN
jgi:Ca2+/Na+ antiporter